MGISLSMQVIDIDITDVDVDAPPPPPSSVVASPLSPRAASFPTRASASASLAPPPRRRRPSSSSSTVADVPNVVLGRVSVRSTPSRRPSRLDLARMLDAPTRARACLSRRRRPRDDGPCVFCFFIFCKVRTRSTRSRGYRAKAGVECVRVQRHVRPRASGRVVSCMGKVYR